MYSRNALMHGDVRLKSNFEKREVTAGHNKVFNLVNDQNIKNEEFFHAVVHGGRVQID